VGDTFFIINQGRVQVTASTGNTKASPAGTEAEVDVLRELGRGDFFGEKALLKEERRTANVVAISPGVTCLTLDRESFLQLMSPLKDFLETIQHEHYTRGRESPKESSSAPSISVGGGGEEDADKSGSAGIISSLTLDDLEVVTTLGVGGFGRVELVQVNVNGNTKF